MSDQSSDPDHEFIDEIKKLQEVVGGGEHPEVIEHRLMSGAGDADELDRLLAAEEELSAKPGEETLSSEEVLRQLGVDVDDLGLDNEGGDS